MKVWCDELRFGIYWLLKELREGRGWGFYIIVLIRKIINGDFLMVCFWFFMFWLLINCVMYMDNFLSIYIILFCVFIFNKEIFILINMLKYY